MKVSEHWLRTWANPDLDTRELAEQITMAGLEVDAITPAAGDFSGVVVAEIVAAQPHPNADKLQLCQVATAAGEPLPVVCGAPNARPGLRVAFAPVGALLPDDFKIKKAKLRGVESQGMICSAAELGLSDDHAGILELPEDAPLGVDLRTWLELDDQCIEVDLTPNRGDCLSVAGLARELGVLNRLQVQAPACEPVTPQQDQTFPVEVQAPDACPRYLGRVIRGINPDAGTPLWMSERLRRSGLRSIDPVVDVTNYIMLELGQPMHAFDLQQLKDGIQVRYAEPGERLQLLDGQTLDLETDSLLIADGRGPLALAGIMGGQASGVTSQTRDIFLECAFFSPLALAGKARQYGLHTDSSHRFERGVDPRLQHAACERATALLLEILGGEPGPILEALSEVHLPRRPRVTLRRERIRSLLALDLEASVVEDILQRLGLEIASREDAGWQLDIPSYRFDLEREEDLLEEIARIHGYNRLPVHTPRADLGLRPASEGRKGVPELRRLLLGRGYQEAITYSFVPPELQQRLDPEHEPLALANPISADMAVMRTSLWPGLVMALQHNQHRQQPRVRLFETGMRFVPEKEQSGEKQPEKEQPGNAQPGESRETLTQDQVLAGAVFGPRDPEGWAVAGTSVDFFDVKNDLESLLALGGHEQPAEFVPARHPALHPGQCARIERDGAFLGYLGALHPAHYKALDLQGPVFLFELSLAGLQEAELPQFRPLSRQPETRRDLALVLGREIPVAEVLQLVREQAGEWLTRLRLFDVYEGEGVENGQKSLALGLTWQHPSRTLNDEEINSVFSAIVNAAQERFEAHLRG